MFTAKAFRRRDSALKSGTVQSGPARRARPVEPGPSSQARPVEPGEPRQAADEVVVCLSAKSNLPGSSVRSGLNPATGMSQGRPSSCIAKQVWMAAAFI